jgi:hypothetical protein
MEKKRCGQKASTRVRDVLCLRGQHSETDLTGPPEWSDSGILFKAF